MRRLAAILGAALAACGGDDGGDGDGDPPAGVFDPAIVEVRVELDFETGRAPYTGPIVGFGDTFGLTSANLRRVLGPRRALLLPTTTAAMEDVGPIADEELTPADLLALAATHRDDATGGNAWTYYVLFVSGHYADGSGPRPDVLGVSIGSTGVIAMFKDVIAGTAGLVPDTEKFVEQATLIHELGHALGLVNNGVAVTSAHHDAAHGAHCTDDRCVMYYLNEGAADMVRFVGDRVTSGNVILLDDACLADVDALTGGPD
jgi:hypothetical protein